MENPYQAPTTHQAPPAEQATPLTIKQILFSLDGRITRAQWWLYFVLLIVAFYALMAILIAVVMNTGSGLSNGLPPVFSILLFVFYIVFGWISICINAKRCHDSNKSGWWQLVPVYSLILCGFIPGTVGRNQFGPDPLNRSY